MNYGLVKDIIDLIQDFEKQNSENLNFENDVKGFKHWIFYNYKNEILENEPDWEGKEKGRSPESVINTFIVHMNNYAKNYSKSAITNSDFSTQEDFIYLINLKAFGAMNKMELIKKNIQEKPAGMQIINRLIKSGWVEQNNSEKDRRSKIIVITKRGLEILEKQMDKIRKATRIVTGDLTYSEKMELIRLLNKLDDFHKPIYQKNIKTAKLLDVAFKKINEN